MIRTDPRTLGWLNRALNHEMSAVQQYMAQRVLARLWGDAALADRLGADAMEELDHAEHLMRALIEQGVTPSAGALRPPRLGPDADSFAHANRQIEADAVRLYREALAHARQIRDQHHEALFADLLAAEMEHLAGIEEQGS
ncbi:ferritin-like domain-containing protein [Acidiphilium acidophilum]|uniref:Ferritin-like domain-containing protein n=1 Tax=Acidiphilium acidophilum TaxID=76588 RepID=A0AAW9DN93_ACIAO|nr:ferritin-like domain-containing protein [Acidiphilium acidophilum]MDX5930143.1 ferritin-like domain-containing protein [Acidiphilium acidophilum]GBR76408.1 bacterioferritin [Acidiphilium acidophilum DSM 700]